MPHKTKSKQNGDGSVFKRTHKRKNGQVVRWYAEVMVNGHTHNSPPFLTEPEAKKWLAGVQNDKYVGNLPDPVKDSVGEYIDKWIRVTASMEVGPSTQRLYRNLFNWYVNPTLGAVKLQALKPEQIRLTFRKLLDDGKSARTVQMVRVLLRRSMNQAVEDGILTKNPVEAAKAPKSERPEPTILTPEQMAIFIEAAQEERLGPCLILAATTGLRRGELLALRWQDIDLQKSQLRVARTMKQYLNEQGKERWMFGTPKTKASQRTLDLPEMARVLLVKWRKDQWNEQNECVKAWEHPELVFTTETGTPVSPNNLIKRDFARTLKRAGLPEIRFHDLRHSFATLLADQGVSDMVMQKVMGHSHINITKTLYAQVLERQKKEAAQAVDNYFKAAKRKTQ